MSTVGSKSTSIVSSKALWIAAALPAHPSAGVVVPFLFAVGTDSCSLA